GVGGGGTAFENRARPAQGDRQRGIVGDRRAHRTGDHRRRTAQRNREVLGALNNDVRGGGDRERRQRRARRQVDATGVGRRHRDRAVRRVRGGARQRDAGCPLQGALHQCREVAAFGRRPRLAVVREPPAPALFPYTTLFRSGVGGGGTAFENRARP